MNQGFASSALKAIKGQKGWDGRRIWLDINSLLGSKVEEYQKKMVATKKTNRFDVCQFDKRITHSKNPWLEHLCLLEDCMTDPKGIEVRAVGDMSGCMYLQGGKVGKHLAYVLGPMIKNLEAIGYKTEGEDQNLYAFPVSGLSLLTDWCSTIGVFLLIT